MERSGKQANLRLDLVRLKHGVLPKQTPTGSAPRASQLSARAGDKGPLLSRDTKETVPPGVTPPPGSRTTSLALLSLSSAYAADDSSGESSSSSPASPEVSRSNREDSTPVFKDGHDHVGTPGYCDVGVSEVSVELDFDRRLSNSQVTDEEVEASDGFEVNAAQTATAVGAVHGVPSPAVVSESLIVETAREDKGMSLGTGLTGVTNCRQDSALEQSDSCANTAHTETFSNEDANQNPSLSMAQEETVVSSGSPSPVVGDPGATDQPSQRSSPRQSCSDTYEGFQEEVVIETTGGQRSTTAAAEDNLHEQYVLRSYSNDSPHHQFSAEQSCYSQSSVGSHSTEQEEVLTAVSMAYALSTSPSSSPDVNSEQPLQELTVASHGSNYAETAAEEQLVNYHQQAMEQEDSSVSQPSGGQTPSLPEQYHSVSQELHYHQHSPVQDAATDLVAQGGQTHSQVPPDQTYSPHLEDHTHPHSQTFPPDPQAYPQDPQSQTYSQDPQTYPPDPQAYPQDPQSQTYSQDPQTYPPDPQAYPQDPQSQTYSQDPLTLPQDPQSQTYSQDPQTFPQDPQSQTYSQDPQTYPPDPQAYSQDPHAQAYPQDPHAPPDPQTYPPSQTSPHDPQAQSQNTQAYLQSTHDHSQEQAYSQGHSQSFTQAPQAQTYYQDRRTYSQDNQHYSQHYRHAPQDYYPRNTQDYRLDTQAQAYPPDYPAQPYGQSYSQSQHPQALPHSQPLPHTQAYAQDPPHAQAYAQDPPHAQAYAQDPPRAQSYAQDPPPAQVYAQDPPPALAYAQDPPPAQVFAQDSPPAQAYAQDTPPAQTHTAELPPTAGHAQPYEGGHESSHTQPGYSNQSSFASTQDGYHSRSNAFHSPAYQSQEARQHSQGYDGSDPHVHYRDNLWQGHTQGPHNQSSGPRPVVGSADPHDRSPVLSSPTGSWEQPSAQHPHYPTQHGDSDRESHRYDGRPRYWERRRRTSSHDAIGSQPFTDHGRDRQGSHDGSGHSPLAGKHGHPASPSYQQSLSGHARRDTRSGRPSFPRRHRDSPPMRYGPRSSHNEETGYGRQHEERGTLSPVSTSSAGTDSSTGRTDSPSVMPLPQPELCSPAGQQTTQSDTQSTPGPEPRPSSPVQLVDPRLKSQAKKESPEEKHYLKSSKYAGFTSSGVSKHSAMLKRTNPKRKEPKSRKGPLLIEPHRTDLAEEKPPAKSPTTSTGKTSLDTKEDGEASTWNGPKPLTGFKIPKSKGITERESKRKVAGAVAGREEKRSSSAKGESEPARAKPVVLVPQPLGRPKPSSASKPPKSKTALLPSAKTTSKGANAKLAKSAKAKTSSKPAGTARLANSAVVEASSKGGSTAAKPAPKQGKDMTSLLSSLDASTLQALASSIQQVLHKPTPVSDSSEGRSPSSAQEATTDQEVVTVHVPMVQESTQVRVHVKSSSVSEALASDLDTNRPSPPRPVSHLVSVEPHPNQPAPPLYQPAPHLDQPTPHLDQPTPNKSWQVTSKAVMEERSLPTCTDDDTVPSPGAASSENAMVQTTFIPTLPETPVPAEHEMASTGGVSTQTVLKVEDAAFLQTTVPLAHTVSNGGKANTEIAATANVEDLPPSPAVKVEQSLPLSSCSQLTTAKSEDTHTPNTTLSASHKLESIAVPFSADSVDKTLSADSEDRTTTVSPLSSPMCLPVTIQVGAGLEVCQSGVMATLIEQHKAPEKSSIPANEASVESVCVGTERTAVKAMDTDNTGGTSAEETANTSSSIQPSQHRHEHSCSTSLAEGSSAVFVAKNFYGRKADPLPSTEQVEEIAGTKEEGTLTDSQTEFSREFFNTKYMYKEYNLRRTRKRTIKSPQPPAKKSNVELKSDSTMSDSVAPFDTLSEAVGSQKRSRSPDSDETTPCAKQLKTAPDVPTSSSYDLSITSPLRQVSVSLQRLSPVSDTLQSDKVSIDGSDSPEDADTVNVAQPTRKSARRTQMTLKAKSSAKEGRKTPTKEVVTEQLSKTKPQATKVSGKENKTVTKDGNTGAKSISVFDFDEDITEAKKPSAEPISTTQASPKRPPGKGRKSRRKEASSQVDSTSSTNLKDTVVCSLCKLQGHASDLGFLFGPYRYKQDPLSPSQKLESGVEASQEQTEMKAAAEMVPIELWVHEDCAVWAPGVCLVGRELKGLLEAATDGEKMVCSSCNRRGATLCCMRTSRGCKMVYHYLCAREAGCLMSQEQFMIHCPKHKEGK